MVNNLVFRWPKPLFFIVLGVHGIYTFMKGNSHSPPMEKLAIHVLNVVVCAEHISRAIFVQLESDRLWGSDTFSWES